MSDLLSAMMDMQEALQRNSYGVSPRDLDDDRRVQYIKDMVLAATNELHELLNETTWKPWTVGPRVVNHNAAVKELGDLWHFMLNLTLALDLTPDQVFEVYTRKNGINASRMATNYDGRSTKCPECGRALDDTQLVIIADVSGNITRVSCECGVSIPLDVVMPFVEDRQSV